MTLLRSTARFLLRNLRPRRLLSRLYLKRGVNLLAAAAARACFAATRSRVEFCFSPEITVVIRGVSLQYDLWSSGNILGMDGGGPWEENDVRFVLSRLAPGSVFYDVGANIGWYALNLAVHRRGVRIVCFEPFADALEKNLALNGVADALIFRVALGDREGWVAMTADDKATNHVIEGRGHGVQIPLRTLDGLVAEYGLPPPNVLKIDVEGYEFRALKGAEDLLRRHRPLILCEITELHRRYGISRESLLEYLRGLGYRACEVDRKLSVRTMTWDEVRNVTRPPGICKNWVFSHAQASNA